MSLKLRMYLRIYLFVNKATFSQIVTNTLISNFMRQLFCLITLLRINCRVVLRCAHTLDLTEGEKVTLHKCI